MKLAKVYMEKMVQHDNWTEGAYGKTWVVYSEEITIKFEDSNDFRQKLAEWTSNHFDVNEDDFVTYVSNELENNRFEYNQTEDEEGNLKQLTEQDPDGYLADYTFWVNEVYEEIDFIFEDYRG